MCVAAAFSSIFPPPFARNGIFSVICCCVVDLKISKFVIYDCQQIVVVLVFVCLQVSQLVVCDDDAEIEWNEDRV